MMTTQMNEMDASFEVAVQIIETHPSYVELDGPTQRQIDDIIRFARTSPDKHVYTRRLLAALD